MPIIEVRLFKGQPASVKTRLINAMTDAFRMVVPAPSSSLTVILTELERDNYMRGGAMRRPSEALPEPVGVIMSYLTALQAGDLTAVRGHLSEACAIHLPGGNVIADPGELVTWARTRMRVFKVQVLGTDASPGPRGPVVHLRGRQSGEFPDGTPFEGIRFSTRYEFDARKIARIDMWSDLAEHAAAQD